MYHIPNNHFKYRTDNIGIPTLYIDLDGVILDFFRYFCHVFRMKINERGFMHEHVTAYGYATDKKLRAFLNKTIANQTTDYWFNMPYTQLGHLLWDSLKYHRPYIFYNNLENDPGMEIGRLKQIRRRLKFRYYQKYMSKELSPMYSDLNRLIINQDKAKYARNALGVSNILIDDSVLACDAWEEAGGKAFLYIDSLMVVERIISQVKIDMDKTCNLDFLLQWDQRLQKYVH